MNKGITLLILIAVLGAMTLVLYSHSGSEQAPTAPRAEDPLARAPASAFDDSGPASPLQSPQGDSGSLRRIDPPLSSARPAPDGAPVPVTLGPDGQPVKPAPTAPVRESKPTPAPVRESKPTPAPVRESKPTPAPVRESKPAPAPPAPKAETAKVELKPAAPKTEAAAPPATPGSAGASTPQSENRLSGGAPGLTPWATPPKNGTAAPSAPPQTPAQSGAPEQAQTPDAPPPAGLRPEQRSATDPIKTADLSSTGSHTLKDISLSGSGQNVVLRIEADGLFPYKSFALTGPDRLVVDLPGSWRGMRSPTVPASSVVRKVRLGQQPGGPRLVLDLSAPAKGHTAVRKGNAVEIRVQ